MPDLEAATPPAGSIDPTRLILLIERAGWRLVGGREGVYSRFAPPESDDSDRAGGLIVPLDRGAVDYERVMRAALETLTAPQFQARWQAEIVPRLATTPFDAFRFRKETSAPRGLILWRQGEQLIQSARAALTAGAKAYLDRMRHFSNKNGTFANRYLDAVLMGQTAPGSYVVTAFAPAQDNVPISSSRNQGLGLEHIDVAPARLVSEAVAQALQATHEAVLHFREQGSMSGFEDGVERGISFEMTTALKGIAENADEADITVEWDPAVHPAETPLEPVNIRLTASDHDVLEKASTRLASTPPVQRARAFGRVHLLTKKQAGGPGVVGVTTVTGDPARTVRVHLSSEDYHRAVQAHDAELGIEVTGDIEREGNLHWMYRAHVVDVRDLPEPTKQASRRQEKGNGEIAGQTGIDI